MRVGDKQMFCNFLLNGKPSDLMSYLLLLSTPRLLHRLALLIEVIICLPSGNTHSGQDLSSNKQ